MSIKAMSAVSELHFTNSTMKFVLMALANSADDEGLVNIGPAEIAEFCSISRQTVNRHLKKLEDEGYIRYQRFHTLEGKPVKACRLTGWVGLL